MTADGKKYWLVTGGNSGLGLAIVLAALQAGHHVLATARNVSTAMQEHPEVEKMGGTWLQLDVTSADTERRVKQAIKRQGDRLDIVVNNAGHMILTSLEDAR